MSLSTAQAEAVRHRAAEEEAITREQRRSATLRVVATVKVEGEGSDIFILSSSSNEDQNNDDENTIALSDDEDK